MDPGILLRALSSVPGVSTRTAAVARRCAEALAPYVDRVETDEWGCVRGYIDCGIPGAPMLMLDAHIDQVGLLVNGIDGEGFLSVQEIGLDERLLVGLPVNVIAKGGALPGVLVPRDGRLSVGKTVSCQKLCVDTGLSADEVKALVAPGDMVVYANEPFDMPCGRVCCKAVDDRSCFAVLVRTAEKLQAHRPPWNVVFSGTDREELGGPAANAAASRVKPDLFFAIDVCHANSRFASDGEDMGKGPSIPHGGGLRPECTELLETLARTYAIPVQRFTYGYIPGTNAGEVMIADTGYRCAGLSLPMRYMHTPGEVVQADDMEAMSELLFRFALACFGKEAA